jgi:hypothetical protein
MPGKYGGPKKILPYLTVGHRISGGRASFQIVAGRQVAEAESNMERIIANCNQHVKRKMQRAYQVYRKP